jgi:hypothetical protein
MDSGAITLGGTRIRDLGLRIEGTRLEPVIERFEREVAELGLPLAPRCYLSSEWGVPFGTIAIAIPFYLAREDLRAIQRERAGYLEGDAEREILRYLRHELGHVVNYAYKLYDDKEWVELFGSITQPYLEEYRPEPFSRRYVRHLPGWYAQKHPDEDWAETFAVWMTPGATWRRDYEGWPALEKLEYVDRVVRSLRGRAPLVVNAALDEPVSELGSTLDEFYGGYVRATKLPHGIEGALRAVFDDGGRDAAPTEGGTACKLIESLLAHLPTEVYRWTGHFPEHTRALLHTLARSADRLGLEVRRGDEERAEVAMTTFVTALAMNHVVHGTYLP